MRSFFQRLFLEDYREVKAVGEVVDVSEHDPDEVRVIVRKCAVLKPRRHALGSEVQSTFHEMKCPGCKQNLRCYEGFARAFRYQCPDCGLWIQQLTTYNNWDYSHEVKLTAEVWRYPENVGAVSISEKELDNEGNVSILNE